MISINAKILLHYLDQQNQELGKKAANYIDKYTNGDNSIFINNIVICELTWHLEQASYSKTTIISLIQALLATKEFAFENFKLIKKVLELYEQIDLGFSDCFGNIANKAANCSKNIALNYNGSFITC